MRITASVEAEVENPNSICLCPLTPILCFILHSLIQVVYGTQLEMSLACRIKFGILIWKKNPLSEKLAWFIKAIWEMDRPWHRAELTYLGWGEGRLNGEWPIYLLSKLLFDQMGHFAVTWIKYTCLHFRTFARVVISTQHHKYHVLSIILFPCLSFRLSVLLCNMFFYITLCLILWCHISLLLTLNLYAWILWTGSMSYSSFDYHYSGWHTVGALSIFVELKMRIYFTNKQKWRTHTDTS